MGRGGASSTRLLLPPHAQVTARQAGPQLLRQLLEWRTGLLASLGRSNEMLAHRRSLVTEALFLEAAQALVQTDVAILTGALYALYACSRRN